MTGAQQARPYPVGLLLEGRDVVVVGGGTVGQRRVAGLLAAGARVRLVSPQVGPALEGSALAGEIDWVRRRYRAGDLDGAWYAVAATDDPAVNAEVVASAEAARIFCVRADDATRGSAWTPAVGRHDEVTVAVLSNRDPQRSARVRDSIVEGLRTGDVLAPHDRDKTPGVVLVGGGPGDPELITLAGRRALAEADVVVADRLAPRELLSELPATVELVDAAKLPRGRSTTQEVINEVLVDRARAGQRVVRLKGGDSFVFGRGSEEWQACAAAGVPVTVIPGLTSAVAVPGLAGIPVTHRGVAHEFTVVSGHVPPGDPRSLVEWPALARLRGTLVLLMAVDNLAAIADVLMQHGRVAETPVALVQEGSLAAQRVVRSRLDRVVQDAGHAQVRPPAVVVVGPVVEVLCG
ncbi:MAG: Precorrin-2 oxidase @ Sirohydrochlorin ferrochelatase activity of CysG / Uroporphyrinogen-III methyltransferase [uncultured Nocardioidaceae bacterium]|uniref:Precorrin-2 oxidase @ Sirohydrochlorin ferrochelatase activity of CysG / Uroporphyrinogen-III methyltransferase n=1 Tax=uncultured Nocardioidaceae bacterium TaxID=253824 RepID=A0A6J4MA10_9ACTN|nr:MAG: Precorrin-2 oxidase @ Sirohydrochlorin ferrochelatase activity of CysG / Uroporphyrinogen-III methyltransferase [uncultured Nocardioidaceae bacterium]